MTHACVITLGQINVYIVGVLFVENCFSGGSFSFFTRSNNLLENLDGIGEIALDLDTFGVCC